MKVEGERARYWSSNKRFHRNPEENSEIGGIRAKWKIEPSYDFSAARVGSENAYYSDVLLSSVIPHNAPSNSRVYEDSINSVTMENYKSLVSRVKARYATLRYVFLRNVTFAIFNECVAKGEIALDVAKGNSQFFLIKFSIGLIIDERIDIITIMYDENCIDARCPRNCRSLDNNIFALPFN